MTIDLFDPRHPQSPRLSEIIVRNRAFASNERYDLVSAVIQFRNILGDYGAFTRHEVPPELLQSYHVDYYDAQVKNGGHEQFISNSRHEQDFIFGDVATGLAEMGATKHLSIFRAVLTYAEETPERKAGIVERAGFGNVDEWIKSQDRAFFDLSKSDDLPNLNSDWLRKLGCLRIVSDKSWMKEIGQVIASNPLRIQRLEKMGWKNIPDFESELMPKSAEAILVDRLARELCPLMGYELVFVKRAHSLDESMLVQARDEEASKYAGQTVVVGELDTDKGDLTVCVLDDVVIFGDANSELRRFPRPRIG